MILSNLVKDDRGGFINLDENLARHIGAENVDAFHEEAGNLVIDAMTDDPMLFETLMGDDAVVSELHTALATVEARAFGRPLAEAQGVRRELSAANLRESVAKPGVMRNFIHAELLTNGVINDRTMRNPKIMAVLDKRVRELFESRSGAKA